MTNPRLLILFAACFFSWSALAQQSLNTNLVATFTDPTPAANNRYNDVWGYVDAQGREYAIFGTRVSSLFVDITNPANPTLVTEITNGSSTTWRDYKTYKNYAYSICDSCNEGMYVYDLSNLPSSVSVVRTIKTEFVRSHNIYIDEAEGRLYVVGVPNSKPNPSGSGSLPYSVDLVVYDIAADPANPRLIAEIDFDKIIDPSSTSDFFYIHDLYVQHNIIYASHGYTGYFIWDANNLNNISLIADADYGGYNHSSWISECGGYAYVAEEVPTGLPLQVVDLERLRNGQSSNIAQVQDNLETVPPSETQSTVHNPYVKGDLLYISYYEDGLKVYDIRNPANPVLHAYYDTYSDNNNSYSGYAGAWGTYPFLPSGNILISDITYGLSIVTVEDFDCDGFNHVLFNETQSQNERYASKVATYNNASISANVSSKYTAQKCIELNPNFEVKLGAQVLFTIESCGN